MKELIKTVALEVAEKFFDPEMDAYHAARYVEACIAELSERAEATAYDIRDSNGDGQTVLSKYVEHPNRLIAVTVTKLFTFPPIHDIEAIENRVAEACAKKLEADANAFASACGYEDMGSLSFGRGAHAEVKMGRYNDLLELAEAIRSGEWRKCK